MKSYRWISLLLVLMLALSACSGSNQSTNTPANNAEHVTNANNVVDDALSSAEEDNSAASEMVEDVSETLTFEDDLGRVIILATYPERIVSTAPSITESLYAIGAGEQLVGRDELSFYPSEAAELPSIGSFWGGVPVEAILALEPDLVIVPEIISEEAVAELEALGLTVYWQANPLDFEGLYANLLDLAVLTGHVVEAEALNAELTARVSAVESALIDVEDTPVVFYELDATDPDNPWTAGAGTFIDYVITLAGGVNAAAVVEGEYIQISSETLITSNPDVILLSDAAWGMTPESVAERAGWDTMNAVLNGQVLPFDANLVSVPGPRLVDGLELVAQILHPDLFE